jgi:hypothetical protein
VGPPSPRLLLCWGARETSLIRPVSDRQLQESVPRRSHACLLPGRLGALPGTGAPLRAQAFRDPAPGQSVPPGVKTTPDFELRDRRPGAAAERYSSAVGCVQIARFCLPACRGRVPPSRVQPGLRAIITSVSPGQSQKIPSAERLASSARTSPAKSSRRSPNRCGAEDERDR